ncbi:MAG: flippase [Spirochaetia bacterium]|nr:flippase [Spirochaetia bacterium]
MDKAPSLKKNAALNMFKTAMNLIFPLITFPYTSRILLPDGVGKVNFARYVIQYFVIIASLGISVYGIREVAKVRDDLAQRSKVAKEILSINLISTLVSYILLGIALVAVPKFSHYRALLCIFSATILFNTMGMEWLYNAMEDFQYIAIRSMIFHFVGLALLFIFVRTKEDYLNYAAVSVLASVGGNLCNIIHSRKYIKYSLYQRLELRKHLRPIFIFFAMAAAVKIYTALDTTMLGFLSDDYQVGIYTAATKINRIVLNFVVAISAVLLPRLSYYYKTDKVKFDDLIYKGADVLFMLAVPCAVGLCCVGRPAVLLMSGEHFAAAVPVMKIMNPIILIIGMGNFIGNQLFMPMRKEKWTLYSVLGGAVTNVIFNAILIPRYQAMGAAIATVCAESMVTGIQLYRARDLIHLGKIWRSFGKYLMDSMIMAIPVILCINYIKNLGISSVIGILVGVIVYGILLLIQKNEYVLSFIAAARRRMN